MTLHEAIIDILKEKGTGLTPSQIAAILNKIKTYIKGDGTPIKSSQISARVNKYPHLFTNQGGLIFLKGKTTAKIIPAIPTVLPSKTAKKEESPTFKGDLKSALNNFSKNKFDPKTHSESTIPDQAGNYLICLRGGCKLPSNATKPEFKKFEGLDVIYTGIASTSLRSRDYRQHFTGNNAGRSTLRKSIGSLFGYKKVPRDKDPNSGKTKFGDADEEKLSKWMENNLIMFFCPTKDFKVLEIELINYFNPPLNLKDNHNTANQQFRRMLSDLRSETNQ